MNKNTMINNINNNTLNNKNANNNLLHNNNFISSKVNRLPGTTILLDNQPRFTSTWNTFRTIIRTEGISSLWAGIWPTLLISIPITILYFPLYDKVKYLLGYNEQDPGTSYIPPLAGMLCRTSVVILFNPLELYRTKLQSTKLTLPQLIEVSRVSFQHQGPKFLFHGTFAALLRDVPFSAIYWYLYEKIKSSRLKHKQTTQSQPIDTLIAGALAGSVAALVTVPFDVIKTHWQIELGSSTHTSSSSYHMITKLWSQKGLRGLFAGATPRLIKVAPACALMITAYESFKSFFIKYNVVAAENI